MRILVIGQGSIGQRHAALLAADGHEVATVSRHAGGAFRSIETALSAAMPDYVVVASETARHLDDLDELARSGFGGPVLVEKPLSVATPDALPDGFSLLGVAYQLRFHPVLRRLRDCLAGERAISAQVYVGQYLPTWRPGRDYRTTESARTAAGGGVLLDLSHELDYLDWLFGAWTQVAAINGRFGPLEIETDDVAALLLGFARCPAVTVELNYLDRQPRRRVVVNTAGHSFEADLIAGTVRRDGETAEVFRPDRDAMHRASHAEMLSGRLVDLTDMGSALRTMRLVDAARRAARARTVEVADGC